MTRQPLSRSGGEEVKPMQEKLLLRAEEAAELLGVGRTKVYELIGRGEMPVVRIGRCLRIPRRTLDQWINDQVVGLEPPL